jgi:AraC-like DNA-binding protein
MKTVFDTSQFPPEHRNLAWKTALCEIYVNLETELEEGTEYSGCVRKAELGELAIMQSVAAKQTIVRRNTHLKDKDCYYLQLMQQGRSLLEQDNRKLLGDAASGILYYAGESYRLQYAMPSSCFYIEIPRASLINHLGGGTEPSFFNFSTAMGMGKVFADYCILLSRESDFLPQNVHQNLADQLLELMALVIKNPNETYSRIAPARKVPLCTVKEFIDNNLSNPLLTIQTIASHHRVSTRYVQYLFKESGTSTAEWIWQRRLQRSYNLLIAPEHAHRSVTDIAMSIGFNSSSHFSNAFKAKYGSSPRDIRHEIGQKFNTPSTVPGV